MRNKLLVVNFFPAFFPPSSGGEQRYYYLYFYLSNFFDITLLSPTHPEHTYEVVEFNARFREHRVPKELIHIQLHQEMNLLNIGPECSGLVVALAGGSPNKFHDVFLDLSDKADLIIHECPFTLPYDLNFSQHNKPRIYNSYNVEYLLMNQIFQGPSKDSLLKFIKSLESDLLQIAQLTFATSEEEKLSFCDIYRCNPSQIYLAPNGFEPDKIDSYSIPQEINSDYISNKPIIIFMGSGHPPNIEAGIFICEEIAPKLLNFDFFIMGSVCKYIKTVSENIKLLGFITDADKRRLLSSCSVAINPMFSGAGTNLKMLDYMAAAAPIVTTKIGARGLSLCSGTDALIVEHQEFSIAISKLVSDEKLAKKLGKHAKQIAFDHYTWQSIADSIAPSIQALLNKSIVPFKKSRPRNKLLVINDFSVAHAVGGGQIRIKELLTELATNFDITLLCLSDLPEYTETIIKENFLEVCVPKTASHRLAEAEKNVLSYISINDIVAADYCLYNSLFRQLYLQYAATATAIIFEHPYLAPMLTLLPHKKTVIYSSLNCEFHLKKEILKSRLDFEILLNRVNELEKKLLEIADLIVCVSKADRDCFANNFPDQNYLVIENGVRCDNYKGLIGTLLRIPDVNPNNSSLALFVGSSHKPNIDAAYYIRDVLAPALPDMLFGIIGSVCDVLRHHTYPSNVWLFGILDEDVKNYLMRNATIAINPLFTGGGSSLKVPDFFAAGLPLISTEVGVRGYDLLNGTHYLQANSSNFVEHVRQLAFDMQLQEILRQNSLAFVKENLDWPILGVRYTAALNLLIKKSYFQRKLLVVTYRFTDPPLGGAEVYLNNILRELAAIGEFAIDVATYEVEKIFNKWHFSADYIPLIKQPPKPDYLTHIVRFPLDIQNQDTDFQKCQKLFSLWMSESLSQGREFLDLLDRPTLLGGWNFPERHTDGSFARWSGTTANIFLGVDAKSIRMKGTVAHDGLLIISMGGMNLQSGVSGTFDLQIYLPKVMDSILEIHVDVSSSVNDVRELGAYFNYIAVEQQNGWHPVKLDEDYTTYARAIYIERWVHSLVKQTKQRKFEDDQIFLDVRGPKSSALLQWLDNNISSYDVVLAQGVPFASSVDALHASKRHGVPCVLLPHFHMEDKYYHWRSFYQAFQCADLVLAAPNSAKRIFFDKLGVNSVAVLGGAADPSEFTPENLKIASEAFIRLHRSSRPFILILGRKAGGKNYHLTIEALIHLNQQGYLIDLVMIGPDDDEVKIDTPNVFYFGMQPRDIVIGALAECLCVVNMSSSESFGIVLIEAWLAGRPVIAQRQCAAFAELVRDGENGFLAETSEEISDYVIKFLSNISYANRCGEVGCEEAKRYTWFNLAKSINNCLKKISINQVHSYEQ